MTGAATFDAAPFILAAYGLMAVVVGGAIVLTLLEARYWARRARAIDKASADARGSADASSAEMQPR